MKEFLYELHCHTSPVSACATADVEETLRYYKSMGYDGVFITNHFIDGNMCWEMKKLPYEKQIEFYFSDYEKALSAAESIGIKVFCGIESSGGADVLVYGLDKEWFLSHREYLTMPRREMLDYFRANGAFVVQAHPFRKAWYINNIQLFTESVDAIETVNAGNTDEENRLAEVIADSYRLIKLSGSDNHGAQNHKDYKKYLAGVKFNHPINSVKEFIDSVKKGEHVNFKLQI